MNMKLPKVLAGALLVLALCLFSVTPAFAQPVMPLLFTGDVTTGGDDAPTGTTISAEIEDVEVASVDTSVAGHYAIQVEGSVGDMVVFKVNGVVGGEHEYVDPWETPTVTLNLSIGEALLTAEAGGPYSGIVGATIALSGSASGGTEPYIYAWDLDGDGEYDDATGASPSNSWEAAGTYTISLQVTDGAADTATDTATVMVIAEGGFDPWDYDNDEDDVISKDEALAAVAAYMGDDIEKADALEVVKLYFG